jgi:hypothetical protein
MGNTSKISALLAMIAGLSGLTAGCGDGENIDTGGDSAENVGSVGIKLDLGSDVVLNTINYEITGNGFTKAGTINVTDSSEIRALIGGIPAGTGYSIRLWTNAATNNGASCEGSATFDIRAGVVTTARVSLRCRIAGKTGSVQVEGAVNVCPVVNSLSALPLEASVGGTITLSAEALDLDAGPSAPVFQWAATGGTLTADGASAELECTASGTVSVTVSVSDGDCEDTDSLSVLCTPGEDEEPPTPAVRVNEVESSGGTPGDWVELINAGSTAADISGWIVRDNDDTHISTIPSGTVLAPGAFYIVEETALGFGLGGADSARLYDDSDELVDTYSWTAHATTTYGRCPDGTGDFVTQPTSTKGQPNDCLPSEPTTAAWPGSAPVETVDALNTWTSNLSGLTYQPATASDPGVLWATVNGPGTLYRLLFDGTNYASDTANDWGSGKALHYPDGTGNPDTEGVTKTAWDSPFIYTATERNNDASTVSRLAILRFDTSATGATLTATHEWNVTADLPVVGANLGLEAVTFIPDEYLVANGFRDQSTNAAYDPASYPDHGGGLFFVGVEGTGVIYAYALNHTDSTFVRVATIQSGHPGVMSLEFDRDRGYLWAACDDTCGNLANVLTVDRAPSSPSVGGFIVRRTFERAATLPNANNEGFAIAPETECVGGQKSVFWSDDNNTGGHSLRRGSLPCSNLF